MARQRRDPQTSNAKHIKACPVCQRYFAARRADAKYCSDACRQVAHRRRHRPTRGQRARQTYDTKKAQTYKRTCDHCGRTFYPDGTQGAMIYCSNACKQAAYRARKKAKAAASE